MLRTGVIPIPPARNTAGLVTSLCNVNDPLGRLTLNLVPNSAAFRAVLKPVSRIRIRRQSRHVAQLGIRSGHHLCQTRTPSCPGQFSGGPSVSFDIQPWIVLGLSLAKALMGAA